MAAGTDEDIEVVTPHYRGAHGASVARSGFSCYRGIEPPDRRAQRRGPRRWWSPRRTRRGVLV